MLNGCHGFNGGLGFKRVFQRAIERMAEALLVEVAQALPGDPDVLPLFLGRRADLGGRQIVTVDQGMNARPGDRKKLGYLADSNEGREWTFRSYGTICYHKDYFQVFLKAVL
jgi:hypothetical protein